MSVMRVKIVNQKRYTDKLSSKIFLLYAFKLERQKKIMQRKREVSLL